MAKADDVPTYPLYNSTYTAFRVSPLHHGNEAVLDEANLSNHARKLQQSLTGDTLRGVPIAFNEYNQFARSGPMQDCSWDLLGDEATWQRLHTSKEGEDNDISTASVLRVEPESLMGVHVQLQYERSTHSALLLRDPETDDFAVDGFTSLPLLLVRMPVPLREVLIDYLSKTFDCRVTPLKLQSPFLTSSLEGLLRRLDNKTNSENLSSLNKGVQLQLTFQATSTALRNLDITIDKDDIPGFIAHGKALQPTTTTQVRHKEPFTLALRYYLRHHLALDMTHSNVRVSKAIAGPIALSSDGKIKLFAPSPIEDGEESPTGLAMRDFYISLCAYASGPEQSVAAFAKDSAMDRVPVNAKTSEKRSLRDGDRNAMSSSPSKKRAKSVDAEGDEIAVIGVQASARKQRQISVPVEPPPPYELVDPRLMA